MEDRVRRLEKEVEVLRAESTDTRTRLAVAENNIQEIKGELKSIKSDTNWIIRLIIGGIIMAVIGFLISGGFKV
jgi:chromosome segregation ATPase